MSGLEPLAEDKRENLVLLNRYRSGMGRLSNLGWYCGIPLFDVSEGQKTRRYQLLPRPAQRVSHWYPRNFSGQRGPLVGAMVIIRSWDEPAKTVRGQVTERCYSSGSGGGARNWARNTGLTAEPPVIHPCAHNHGRIIFKRGKPAQ
ncbi:uncharacterized protein CIMG_13420 [Coccidioides immitis RS]|uniref:Uncharacterized protein n=3 Tax=Coccidioides immitis TaxID=5501 RepID=A0A0E1RZ68_COCIM|nr:uncharacterized protein CIMG_13420 [Coccidioides immitis RS]EAS34089.1 hypothetical protein CIMG_13420 [Coccidioides immitis RS]KMU77840.1 hypothetical protein CISG_01596 [Coccidioides immitis RMSCC 3703]KMU85774.1 hypothetical protein CIHG_03814 [Coccidioides immitis H538.4]